MKKDIKTLSISAKVDGEDLTGKISDGYHTFDELYDHRITLFIALCRLLSKTSKPYTVWRSKYHSDLSTFEGWFILGIGMNQGDQITYHIPSDRWEETDFADTCDKAPVWDGHSPADVLERLKKL